MSLTLTTLGPANHYRVAIGVDQAPAGTGQAGRGSTASIQASDVRASLKVILLAVAIAVAGALVEAAGPDWPCPMAAGDGTVPPLPPPIEVR